jgi:hypothetical protein
VAETTAEQLQSVLAERHDQLTALPEVVGWGVGLGANGHPIVDVFVSAPPSEHLVTALGQLFDEFEVVVQSGPANAD